MQEENSGGYSVLVSYVWDGKQLIQKANLLIPELNKIEGLHIGSLDNGTNSYKMVLKPDIDPALVTEYLYKKILSGQLELMMPEDTFL